MFDLRDGKKVHNKFIKAHYKYHIIFDESKIAPLLQRSRIRQWVLLDVAVLFSKAKLFSHFFYSFT